jgi:hypothetical protein
MLAFGLTQAARAVPEAEHVRLRLLAQRMNVNDHSIRKQVRVDLTASSSDASRLDNIENSRLTVVNPQGISAKVRPYKVEHSGKRFKAARADVVFKLVEDSASVRRSNVPQGFFAGQGPYRVRVDMRWESYKGGFSFGDPIALRVTQDGVAAQKFVLDSAQQTELSTLPQTFGPVYYKRHDVTNFMYQIANMDDALQSADFHAEVESPQYFFQLRLGRSGESQTQLLDPTVYIAGAEHHLIRSEQALSPMLLPAGGLSTGQTLLADFSRSETMKPDSVFHSASENFSDQVVVQDRVVYAFEVR